MTSLTIPPNDVGQQNLKIDNTSPATTPAVSTVPAVRGVPETPQPTPTREENLESERRKGDRRHGDRRQHQNPVILDTRSKHDRRSQSGHRASDHENRTEQIAHGVDKTI